jgi:hypothetical protein
MKDPEHFIDKPAEEIDTVLKAFKRSVSRFPDNNFLGTRDPTQEGSPYVWKSWKQCDQITDNFARGNLPYN